MGKCAAPRHESSFSMSDPSVEFATVFQHLKAGRLSEAEALCRRLATVLPRDPRPHALLARVLGAAARPDAAQVAVDRALALDGNFVPALVEQAQLARSAGDHARAVAALERLVALQPGNAGMHYDLGVERMELQRYEDARAPLEPGRPRPRSWPATGSSWRSVTTSRRGPTNKSPCLAARPSKSRPIP